MQNSVFIFAANNKKKCEFYLVEKQAPASERNTERPAIKQNESQLFYFSGHIHCLS